MQKDEIRERLVELIDKAEEELWVWGYEENLLVDHLIANGVIILDKNEHVCRWFNGAQHKREYPCVTCNVNGVVYWLPLPELPKENDNV